MHPKRQMPTRTECTTHLVPLFIGLTIPISISCSGDASDGQQISSSVETSVSGPSPTGLTELFRRADAVREVFSQTPYAFDASCGHAIRAQLDTPGRLMLIGRELTSGQCAQGTLSLTVQEPIGTRRTLTTVRRILDMSTPITFDNNQRTMTTAYDADFLLHNGTRWVVFECGGLPPTPYTAGFGLSGSTCAGELVGDVNRPDTLEIRRESLTMLVDSSEDPRDRSVYSASVPKIFVHQGQMYLYWTAVHQNSVGGWLDITTRGARLTVEAGSVKKLRIQSRTGATLRQPLKAYDTTDGAIVWGLGDDNRSNSVLDTFDVYSDGKYIYATAGMGGWDKNDPRAAGWQSRPHGDARDQYMCLFPISPIAGCYRLVFGRTTNPLGNRAFNNNEIIDNESLPANGQDYAFIYTDADGTRRVVSSYRALPIVNGQVVKDGAKRDLGGNFWSFALQTPPDPSPLINHYYQTILGRGADAGGLEYWKGVANEALNHGDDVKPVFRQMAGQFFLSPEYIGRSRSDADFLADIYRTFFQRALDPGGAAYWQGRLNAGTSRIQIVNACANSLEFTSFMDGLKF